jgi:type II secretory pathway component PulC
MNREKILLGVLGLLVVFAILYYTVWNVPPPNASHFALVSDPSAAPPPPDPMKKIDSVRGAIPKIPTEAVEEKYEWDKDLFATTMTIEEAELPEQRFHLTGIFFTDTSTSSLAIINGEPVRIGDTFEGYEIIEITRNRVILYGNRESLILTLENGGADDDGSLREFSEVFRAARINGLVTFEVRGRLYHTRLSRESER